MASGLAAANDQFSKRPDAIRVCQSTPTATMAIRRDVLEEVLESRVRGRFQCECRGIGEDWKPTQLLQIAEA